MNHDGRLTEGTVAEEYRRQNYPNTTGPVDEFPKSIEINRCANGYIVNVGCKVFVFEELTNLTTAIELYFTAPEKAREKYMGTEA